MSSASLAFADTLDSSTTPPVVGSDRTSETIVPPPIVSSTTDTLPKAPPISAYDESTSTSIVPPIASLDIASTTSIVPPIFSFNTTEGGMATTPATTTATTTPANLVVVTDPAPSNNTASASLFNSNGGFSGGSNTYINFNAINGTLPTTLGDALSCPLLTSYIIPGQANNSNDISKLQIFLNVNDSANIPTDGVLNAATIAAVKNFQAKYVTDIMIPWGNSTPSGQVYITTLKKINSIACATPITLNAQDITIINAYKAQVARASRVISPTVVTATVPTTTAPSIVTPATAATSPATILEPENTTVPSSTPDNSNLVGNAITATGPNFFSRIFSTIAGWFK